MASMSGVAQPAPCPDIWTYIDTLAEDEAILLYSHILPSGNHFSSVQYRDSSH